MTMLFLPLVASARRWWLLVFVFVDRRHCRSTFRREDVLAGGPESIRTFQIPSLTTPALIRVPNHNNSEISSHKGRLAIRDSYMALSMIAEI